MFAGLIEKPPGRLTSLFGTAHETGVTASGVEGFPQITVAAADDRHKILGQSRLFSRATASVQRTAVFAAERQRSLRFFSPRRSLCSAVLTSIRCRAIYGGLGSRRARGATAVGGLAPGGGWPTATHRWSPPGRWLRGGR